VLLFAVVAADEVVEEEDDANVGFLSPIMPTPLLFALKLVPKRLKFELTNDLRIRLNNGLSNVSKTGS
jgi:hypothetical protein